MHNYFAPELARERRDRLMAQAERNRLVRTAKRVPHEVARPTPWTQSVMYALTRAIAKFASTRAHEHIANRRHRVGVLHGDHDRQHRRLDNCNEET